MKTIEQISELFKNTKNTRSQLIISGPCSAETEEQVMQTATELKKLNKVHVFRAGIWKPRTLPGKFEGVGNVGLEWLRNVKNELHLPVTTEVATAKHVYEALKFGIDILWIGARTTTTPFGVQEIADALKGTDIPVLIKNPISPDMDLWIGAIERIKNAGLTKVGVIHRGFSTWEKTKYRNNPHWQIAIELKRRFPDLLMICDPSHITGNKDLIYEVAQKSVDFNFGGLMIESHINPCEALSDKEQQLTPNELNDIIERLHISTENFGNIPVNQKITEIRGEIDLIDELLIDVLGKRMQLSEKIGMYKRDNKLSILQINRWNEIMQTRKDKAEKLGLSGNFIENIFKEIHIESINIQAKVLNQ